MKPTLNRAPYKGRDRNGHDVVLVPLAHGLGPAKIDEADFRRLCDEGWSDQWYLNSGLVRVRDNSVRGHSTSVARLLTRARPGYVVRYADGDRLNLRRSNLYITRGNARGQRAANTKP